MTSGGTVLILAEMASTEGGEGLEGWASSSEGIRLLAAIRTLSSGE